VEPPAPADSRIRWRVYAGLGAEFVPILPHFLLGADLRSTSMPLGLGLELVGKYFSWSFPQGLQQGTATLWSLSPRLHGGYRQGAGAWEWGVVGVAGLRASSGLTEGLPATGSSTILSAEFGPRLEVLKIFGGGARLGVAATILWLVPRPAFKVDFVGPVYRAGAPIVEVGLLGGWGFTS